MLTIAIPTYNRADKVERLLSIIKDEIFSARLQDQVSVICVEMFQTLWD